MILNDLIALLFRITQTQAWSQWYHQRPEKGARKSSCPFAPLALNKGKSNSEKAVSIANPNFYKMSKCHVKAARSVHQPMPALRAAEIDATPSTHDRIDRFLAI